MKILITGVNSALGTAVANSLAGHEIIGLGRKNHRQYPTIRCDFREGTPALPPVDVCLHLGGVTDPRYCQEHPEEAYKINVLSTVALLENARRFVFVSTGSVYGFQDGLLDENRTPEPADDYARTKLLAEREVEKHPNAAVLRYFFPYGPATKSTSLVNRLIGAIDSGNVIDVNESNRPVINPIYISDAVAATKLFCLEPVKGVCNIAGNEVVSIKTLAEMIGEALGKQPVFRPTGKAIKDMAGSTEKVMKVIRPAVDLANGINMTVEWLMKGKAGSGAPGSEDSTRGFSPSPTRDSRGPCSPLNPGRDDPQ